MKPRLLATALLLILRGATPAATITLDAERLKDASGAALPLSGLVILAAGTSGTFTGPTAASFVSGDEIVVKMWDLSGGFSTAGVLAVSTGDVPLTGAWTQGDPLRLYWYPTLDLTSPAPGAGTAYGAYRDAAGLDGSAPWITPGASDTIALQFFTSDATLLRTGGSNAAAAGLASFTVVPEPHFGAFATMALALAQCRRWRPRE